MPREIVPVFISNVPCYEAGATLFAAVAYPDDRRNRQRFHSALCVQTIDWMARNDRDFAHSHLPIRPEYIVPSDKERQRRFRLGTKQLTYRMSAGEMLIPFIENTLKETTGRIKGEKPTVNRMAARVALDLDWSEGTHANVKSRAWGPSKPVVHAAAAIRLMRWKFAKHGRSHKLSDFPFDPELLFAPELLTELIRWSEQFRMALLKIKGFSIAETDTIQFVVA